MSQKPATRPGITLSPKVCLTLGALFIFCVALLCYQTFRNHSGGLPEELEALPEQVLARPLPVVTQRAPNPCDTATEDQATTLLTRLFPDSKMLSFEPLALNDMKSMCLLEVEMLADKKNPGTRGFVYVLPDGERFLNGPLMDKRSQMSVQSTDIQAEIEKARAEQKALVEQARNRTSSSNDEPLTSPEASSQLVSAEQSFVPPAPSKADTEKEIAKRAQFLKTLQALPAITTGTGSKDVYVMFDAQCVHCHKLYAKHTDLAAKHDLRFHWIPIFMNDSSWVMSAFLLKTAKASPDKAALLLKGMMEKTWDPKVLPEDAAAIRALDDADYELARKSTVAFYDATKENKGLGTPVVAFQVPSGAVDVISGEPYESDWLVLDETGSTQAVSQ